MSRRRGRFAVLCTVVLALVVSGCSGDGSGGDGATPRATFDAAAQVKRASAAMAKLTSVAFTLETGGEPAIMLHGGQIRLKRSGDAEGSLTVQQSGQVVEMDVVALGNVIYIKGVTGGWRKVPKALAASLYDPSAVLDPKRGIAGMLTAATSPKPEATEQVKGKDAYRVGVTLPKDVVGGLIPGVDKDLAGQLWIAKADHRLLKVKGALDKGSVTITFTEFNAEYEIKAPA